MKQILLSLNISVLLLLLVSSGLKAQNPANIYMYTPKSLGTATAVFTIYFSERKVTELRNGNRVHYEMYSTGNLSLRRTTSVMGNPVGQSEFMEFTIVPGETYYIKMGMPKMILEENAKGQKEYENSKKFTGRIMNIKEDISLPILTLPAEYQQNTSNNQQHQETIVVGENENMQMRGTGDPMKGLNISTAEDMVLGNYYGLIIGIDNYTGSWAPLKNAVNDAKAVEKIMKENYKMDLVKTLYNSEATRDNIIKQFEWLMANVEEEDNAFIFYSGHGEYNQALNKGFWVPINATTTSISKYISNADIQLFLNGIKSKHTLLVSDACFSGDIFRGSTYSVPFEESDKYYRTVHGLVSRQAITSGGVEPVMDGGREGHSVFTYYFLKALETNNATYFDASQLFSNLKIPVMNNSEQAPHFSPIKNTGDEGGQFVFIKK